VRERFPAISRAAQPLELRPHHEGQRAACRHGARHAGLDAPGHRRAGGIDAHPAAAGQEYLGPGMRVRLPHGDDAVD
jgi:hypothetical protein